MNEDTQSSDVTVGEAEENFNIQGKSDQKKVCGIVMPIAGMGDDYPEAHWVRVRKILQRAIDRSGLAPKLVWENSEIDVIQSGILQNIYENDVIICDVSNLNPNVMLETGLRLSTKKPTIIVTDKVKRPPFDINSFAYIDYQKDLEYNSIESFIERLSKKILEVCDSAENGRYQSYVEQFRFETVQPSSVTVSADDYMKDKVDEISNTLRRFIMSQERARGNEDGEYIAFFSAVALLDEERASSLEHAIDAMPNIISRFNRDSSEIISKYFISVESNSRAKRYLDGVSERISYMIKEAEDLSLPF